MPMTPTRPRSPSRSPRRPGPEPSGPGRAASRRPIAGARRRPGRARARPAARLPADATLVPLEELAPAITAASISRRAFLGFGLAIAGGLVGAAGARAVHPRLRRGRVRRAAADRPDLRPGRQGSGRSWSTRRPASAAACASRLQGREPRARGAREYTRTWIERHTITTDGARLRRLARRRHRRLPADVDRARARPARPSRPRFFEPRLCMQCANSPCTAVCPVGATYRTEDGVDPRRRAPVHRLRLLRRRLPVRRPLHRPRPGERAPNDTPGVADKCTWCYHRISRGLLPACVEVCPVGARKFGDAADPTSEIATLVARARARSRSTPSTAREPRVLYLGPAIEEA